MSLQNLFILAAVSIALLAASRVLRVRLGQEPQSEGIKRLLFIVAFLFVPPVVLGEVLAPAGAAGQLRGFVSVPLYGVLLLGITILTWVAAMGIRRLGPSRPRELLLLALVASQGDPDDVPVDPPVTARLAESVALVDRTNAVFPRGTQFPAQIDRAGFRGFWDALEAATATLEGRIADDLRLGLGVAATARATAKDARSRLDTLRRIAGHHGQAWAT
jgi:hypothetical protein